MTNKSDGEAWEQSPNPYPGLFLETRHDGPEVWVYEGYELRTAEGKPINRTQALIAYRQSGGADEGAFVTLGLCQWCRFKANENFLTCVAFPGGIPKVIAWGDFDHRVPYPGDGGTSFVQRPGVYPTAAHFAEALPGVKRGVHKSQ